MLADRRSQDGTAGPIFSTRGGSTKLKAEPVSIYIRAPASITACCRSQKSNRGMTCFSGLWPRDAHPTQVPRMMCRAAGQYVGNAAA